MERAMRRSSCDAPSLANLNQGRAMNFTTKGQGLGMRAAGVFSLRIGETRSKGFTSRMRGLANPSLAWMWVYIAINACGIRVGHQFPMEPRSTVMDAIGSW